MSLTLTHPWTFTTNTNLFQPPLYSPWLPHSLKSVFYRLTLTLLPEQKNPFNIFPEQKSVSLGMVPCSHILPESVIHIYTLPSVPCGFWRVSSLPDYYQCVLELEFHDSAHPLQSLTFAMTKRLTDFFIFLKITIFRLIHLLRNVASVILFTVIIFLV